MIQTKLTEKAKNILNKKSHYFKFVTVNVSFFLKKYILFIFILQNK